jgi:hypothetical protein
LNRALGFGRDAVALDHDQTRGVYRVYPFGRLR